MYGLAHICLVYLPCLASPLLHLRSPPSTFSWEYLAVFSAYIAFFSIVNSVTRERFQWFECSTVLNVSEMKRNGIEVVLGFFASRHISWFLYHIPISPCTWILYGTLPRRLAAVPAVQLGPSRKSRFKIGSGSSITSSRQFFCRWPPLEPWVVACPAFDFS